MKSFTLCLAFTAALVLGAAPASAAPKKPAAAAPAASQPTKIGDFGDWQAFQVGSGKGKSCFAISNPKERKPAGLNRDPATLFVTHRAGEGAKNELSLIAGFPMKDGVDATLKVGKASYALYAKDANAWVKNAAEEATVIVSMTKAKSAIFEGSSKRGNKTIDTYSMSGLAQAVDAISRACP